ncbi:N-alpha-acetyltransferase 10 [Hibiscus syriacus]|uniref:N-alpha-acetyltransferase 10 n=1 Tax=Hibiscus syriacus TaxID=106335 RepID=A0A6A3C3H8_HIBSY|nr:N-alpha-acetyltransferase 10 [Hibiscus syriacus]
MSDSRKPSQITDATKKVRLKQTDVEYPEFAAMAMDEPLAENFPSYASILAEDIITGTKYGLPSIQFSDHAYKIMEESMSNTVVLKVLGHTIGLNAVTNKTSSFWRPTKPFTLIDLENEYFLSRFQSEDDFDNVLSKGHCLDPLPGLPEYMYKKKILLSIGKLIGRVAKLDFHKDISNRRCFTRIGVYANLKEPLISRVVVENWMDCDKSSPSSDTLMESSAVNPGTNTPRGDDSPGSLAFGPWMIVERRCRRNPLFPACRGNECHDHNTSLVVLRTHRKLGLAIKLMIAAQAAMEQVFRAEYVLLHVRKSNRATFNLYAQTLGYKIHDVEAKYYVDGEDAYDMRKQLKRKSSHHQNHQNHHHHHHDGSGFCLGDARSAEIANTRGDSKSESKARTESGSKAG